MIEKNIHFVCTGNTFRSRLARAYFDSLKIDNIKTSSSGITASRNHNGTICWYTQKLIAENNLLDFIETTWTQTTPEILSKADHIIYMQTHHLTDCQKNFNYHSTNYEIWEINDLSEDKDKDLERIQESREIFQQIKSKIDEFSGRFTTSKV